MSSSLAAKLLPLPILLTGIAHGQTTPAPQLSPQAAYDQVMRPFDITRRSIANWSDSEMIALAVAIKEATAECSARTPDQFSGEDLIAYARLCSVGQQWPTVSISASRYINSPDINKPRLAQAHAYRISADLHINPGGILSDSQAMLKAVPYSNITDETLYAALHYLQLAFMPDALALYATRQPILLNALHTPQLQPPSPETVPIHTLYSNALDYAALQQFSGAPQAAARTVAELDAALPATLPPDEAIPIAETRRQYALLGQPLPHIPFALSLYSPGETPRINENYGSSTVLFLFPEWCAQCVRMAQQLGPTLYRVSQKEVHLYGLLAQPTPPVTAPPKPATKPAPKSHKPESPQTKPAPEPDTSKTPAEQLHGTPTLIVPPETLHQFAATDFPLVIALDPKGIIRFIQPAPETALVAGGFLDQITSNIEKQWPRPTATSATDRTPHEVNAPH